MRIQTFAPKSEDIEPLGLKNIEMRGLGELVVLAGPNGGGKSRILTLLRRVANESTRGDPAHQLSTQLTRAENLIADYTKRLEELSPHEVDGRRSFNVAITENVEVAKNVRIALRLAHRLSWSPSDEPLRVIDFVPRSLLLEDPSAASRKLLLERHKSALKAVQHDALAQLGTDALAYIQVEQDRNWDATHQGFTGSAQERIDAEESYQRLAEMVTRLIGCKLSRSTTGEAMLFDKALGTVPLSDGQKVLLQLAVAVHPLKSDEAYVLILDEPENHLHPAALISVLDQIEAALPRAQLWIATHSVPLLAHLYSKDPSCLHFVAEGGIKFAGRNPELVLNGLLGDDFEQSKLLNFIDLPHQLASTQFASACLVPPTVSDHASPDPQLQQIREVLTQVGNGRGALKILDLGAGKGRLLAGLVEGNSGVSTDIDYIAFDISSTNRTACEEQICRVYDTASRRWYSKQDELLAEQGEECVDVIVMCNVLHEIAPDDWFGVLGRSGLIGKVGKTNGHLVIVEDLRIPMGERPNNRGFFLFDTRHIHSLFDARTEDDRAAIRVSSARNGRLKAHVIPIRFAQQVTNETRTKAIQQLQETAVLELERLRRIQTPDFRSGQELGLWSQQLANCYLYLRSSGCTS